MRIDEITLVGEITWRRWGSVRLYFSVTMPQSTLFETRCLWHVIDFVLAEVTRSLRTARCGSLRVHHILLKADGHLTLYIYSRQSMYIGRYLLHGSAPVGAAEPAPLLR